MRTEQLAPLGRRFIVETMVTVWRPEVVVIIGPFVSFPHGFA